LQHPASRIQLTLRRTAIATSADKIQLRRRIVLEEIVARSKIAESAAQVAGFHLLALID
jgi:hypothetical protein